MVHFIICLAILIPQLVYSDQAEFSKYLKPIRLEHCSSGIQGIDCIYCINLDRRKDKWEAMQRQFFEQKIQGNRVSAVDGWKVLTKKKIKKMAAPSTGHLKRGQMGCLLSHLSVLKDAQKRGFGQILVLEDDVEFLEPIQQITDDVIVLTKHDPGWDVLFLDEWRAEDYGVSQPAHRPGSSMSEVIKQPRQVVVPSKLSRVFYRHGLYAMVVSKKGREKILAHYAMTPMVLTIDSEINHIPGIKMYETGKNFVQVQVAISDTNTNPGKK